MKEILKYQLENGKIPFDIWFNSLDKPVKAKILVRLERLKFGLYGDYRNLSRGLKELKFKSGERIYFYEDNEIIVILLNAGNKKRQSDDITLAEEYLKYYKNSKKYTERSFR